LKASSPTESASTSAPQASRINAALKPFILPISSLREDAANARRHPRRNLEAIQASLELHGQQKPIVISSEGIVRAGNGTLIAAKALGWTEIAAIVYDGATTEMAKHFAVADNRTTDLSEWDYESLATTFKELEAAGLDLGSAGFSTGEVEALVMSEWKLPEPGKLPAPTDRTTFQLSGDQRAAFLRAKALLSKKEGTEFDDHESFVRIVEFFLAAHVSSE